MVLLLIICVIILIWAIKLTYGMLFPKDKRELQGYKEEWFGRGLKPEEPADTTVHPFKIDVPEDVLKDLKNRLDRTRLEDPLEDSKFHYGFNPSYLRTLVEHWKNEYDWRKCEKELNKFPHFKTNIEGIDVHFMHVKPDIPEGRHQLKVIPLMLIHGWPGSFTEFYKMIPILTTPRPDCDFVFEVICPSIPGYGFSESSHQKGCNARATARIFITLMERIDRPHFYVQGGDWGSYISSLMARYYSPRVKGLHVNMYFFSPKSWDLLKFLLVTIFPSVLNPDEYKTLYPLKRKLMSLLEESGYFHIQTTKPDTLGSGMSDSPAGMAAYLLEKFCVATNRAYLKLEDGGLTKKFTMDELLTNVMVYWVNNNFTAAARFYKENMRDVLKQVHESIPVTVPSAVAVFPNEVLMYPRMMMSQQMKNLVSYHVMPRGGHFAAMEEPQLLADDLWQFVNLVEKKYY